MSYRVWHKTILVPSVDVVKDIIRVHGGVTMRPTGKVRRVHRKPTDTVDLGLRRGISESLNQRLVGRGADTESLTESHDNPA